MTLIIALALFLFLTISGFAWFAYMRPSRVLDNIASAAPLSSGSQNAQSTQGGFRTVLQWVGQKATDSPQESGITRRVLGAAGCTSDMALPLYAGIRLLAMGGLGLFVFFVLDWFRVILIMRIGGGVLAGFVAGMACGIILEEVVKRRRERISFCLPDALGLLVGFVESRLGLDQASRAVCCELAPPPPRPKPGLSI